MRIGVITASYVFELSDYDASTPWSVAQSRFAEGWSPEKLDALLERIASLGFDSVELWRPSGGFEQWTDEQLALVRDSLERHGVTLAAYCVSGIRPDTEIEPLFAYAAKLGAPMCTGSLTNENLESVATRLAEVCGKHAMQFGIENHGRAHSVGAPEQMLALARRYAGRIGACPDTANFFNDGVDPLEAVSTLAEVTIHTHLKDTDGSESCALGEGKLPMAEIIRRLRDSGYNGVYSVEREGGGNPDPLLRRSADFIRSSLGE